MYKYLINILFPKLCIGCEDLLVEGEPFLCANCLHDLPLTNLHVIDSDMIKNIFYGSVEFQNASALFFYHKKETVQKLIHHLKYKNREDISVYLGKWYGADLKMSDYYKGIDVVVPVPLHKKRLRQRGYNQVAKFGQEIAKSIDAGYNDKVLLREKNTSSQTVKDRVTRWRNVETIFKLGNTEELKGKHILLVDDVITTGATIKACAEELKKISGIKLSLAVMAYTE